MATLGAMKARIAAELDRSDLTSFIANAISDAILFYEQKRFWFNESRDLTFSTVGAQRIYTSSDAAWIASVIEIDGLFVTVGGQNRDMRKEAPEELELLSDNSAAQGAPYSWAYFNKSIQLYPLPDIVYTVRAVAHRRLDALADDNSTNAWTTEAERLIRYRAKQLLYAELIRNTQAALGLNLLIDQELSALAQESSRRRATGSVKGSGF